MSPPTRRRRRPGDLTPEDEALWNAVVRTIVPLAPVRRPKAAPAPPPAPNIETPAAAGKPVAPTNGASAPKPKERPPAPPLLQPLERRVRRRLSRGNEPLGGRLDLHGLRQAEAHTALRGFLVRAQSDGARVVLVITGKGDGVGERGVLRRLVPHWLAAPDLRPIVVGFEEAHHGHGGAGALYVRLRRRAAKDASL